MESGPTDVPPAYRETLETGMSIQMEGLGF